MTQRMASGMKTLVNDGVLPPVVGSSLGIHQFYPRYSRLRRTDLIPGQSELDLVLAMLMM